MDQNRQHIKKYKQINTGEVGLPLCFEKGEGVYIYDSNNKKYLDFTCGYGVTNTGWLRSELAEVIREQLERSAYAPPWFPTIEAIELSELILKIVPENLTHCARATGGADANEVIHKAVYASSGKKGILSFYRSYHGGTHFNLNISEKENFNLPRLPSDTNYVYTEPPYCYRCPYGKTRGSCNFECTNHIEELFKSNPNIGAFFAEPVVGSGGVLVPPPGYWEKVRDLCTHYHVFLVFDEVLTGFGRVGEMTASELFGIKPDAISFAKAITNGYAGLGVAVLNDELAAALKKHEDVSATFAWTPLACVIAKTNIEIIIRDKLVENAQEKGSILLSRTTELFKRYFPAKLGEIRGTGLMIGIELVEDRVSKVADKSLMRKFLIRAMHQGLMLCASWDFQTIVLMPPLCISDEELEQGLTLMENTLQELKRHELAKECNAVL